MKVQVISVAVLLLAVATFANAQAAGAGASGDLPIGPPDFCQIYQGILQVEANKISTPDLPADLQLRVNAVLENSPQGCADCEGLVFWLNKVCLVSNLRSGLNQLQQIKAEADARAATTTAAPVSPVQ